MKTYRYKNRVYRKRSKDEVLRARGIPVNKKTIKQVKKVKRG